jgi:hypothetical protein
MRFVWNELSRDLKNEIIERALKFIPYSRPYELAQFIDGLHGMQYDWQNEREETVKGEKAGRERETALQKAVFAGIVYNFHPKYESKTDFYDARQLANCIYSLGGIAKTMQKTQMVKMKLTEEVYDSFWNGIRKCDSYFETRGVAIAMEG